MIYTYVKPKLILAFKLGKGVKSGRYRGYYWQIVGDVFYVDGRGIVSIHKIEPTGFRGVGIIPYDEWGPLKAIDVNFALLEQRYKSISITFK